MNCTMVRKDNPAEGRCTLESGKKVRISVVRGGIGKRIKIRITIKIGIKSEQENE